MSEGAFEARVSGKRETKDGIFLVLQIQPDDYYSTPLKELRFNAFLQIGWAEIVDTSVHKIEVPVGNLENEPPNASAVPPKKDKRRFADLPAPQRAAILCDDANFCAFLETQMADEWSGAFAWFSATGEVFGRLDVAARTIRKLCGVKSRADIPNSPVSLERWQTLEKRFQDFLAQRAYGDSVR